MLKTNTSKKIVQTRHQSGVDVLKSLALAYYCTVLFKKPCFDRSNHCLVSPVVKNYDIQN